MASKRVSRGIRSDQYGYRAYIKVGNLQREKRYPPGTKLQTIRDWRDETRLALRKALPPPNLAGSFSAEVANYLAQVKAMPTYAERERHLDLWLAALGRDTPRSAITAADVRTVLHRWKDSGLEAATCNKRRAALMHVFSVLDGRGGRNPVRDVPKFPVSDPLPRGRDPHVLDAKLLLAPRCRGRACCRVLLWTGMRPVELARAQPDDVDLTHKIAVVRTGKGGRTRVVPLTPQAVSAWKEFIAEDCWEHVPQAAPLNRLLKKWTGVETLRVYDLRHSYGTALARRQTRLDVIGSLMGHSTLELTKRYTLAAITPDAAAATEKLAAKAGSRKKASKTA